MSARISALAFVLVVALLSAGGVSALPARDVAAKGVRFTQLPRKVIQGKQAEVAVAAKAGRCSLSIRYAGGKLTELGTEPVSGGHASWRWIIPTKSQAGSARLTASCAGAGKARGRMLIVGAKTPDRIEVQASGFSIRGLSRGTQVSYGVVLKNASPKNDAVEMYVLVNMLDSSDRVVGSVSKRVAVVRAESVGAVGGSLRFSGLAPVDRLEVVVQVGSWAKRSGPIPTLEQVTIAPDPYEPGWVGSVEGELINTDASLILDRTTFGAVIFDASGAVIGGGSGMSSVPLPPGTRVLFKLQTGLDAIQFANAASVLVTVEPSYRQSS